MCQTLAQKINGDVHHFGLLPDEWDFFWDYEARAAVNRVWDRGWLSEVAYQQVLGRPRRMSDEHRIMTSMMLRLYGAVNVVVVCDEAMLLSRLNETTDDKFDKATVLAVNQWYKDNWMHYGVDVMVRCDKRKSYPSQPDIDKILKFYDQRAHLVRTAIGGEFCLMKRPTIQKYAVSDADLPRRNGLSLRQSEKQPV